MTDENEQAKKQEAEEAEAKKAEDTTNSKNDGNEKADNSEELPAIRAAREAGELMRKENDRREELIKKEDKNLTRHESLNALGGGSQAGSIPEKPAKLTDTEYAEALQRGEVNPLKDDGFI